MTPVLRVILPTVNLTETSLHNSITRGANADYITDDPLGNKAIPAAALYAARMNASGQVVVVRARNPVLDPEHTYAGWPIPA